MARSILVFIVMWVVSASGYLWIKQSTWHEKALLVKGILVALLTLAVTFCTLTVFTVLF